MDDGRRGAWRMVPLQNQAEGTQLHQSVPNTVCGPRMDSVTLSTKDL